MGFELPDGKTARNIQEQVAFLTEKVKEIIAAMGNMKMKIKIVEILPDEGEDMTIYFVPSSDPDLENVYKEYMWIDEQWEMIGSTEIDLSDYYTKEEADELFAVIANPVLAGTEAALEGLEVAGTKYKIVSGGKVYLHKVALRDSGMNKIGTFSFYRSNNTHLTKNEIAALLYNADMYNYSAGIDVAYSDAGGGNILKLAPKIYGTNTTSLTVGYKKAEATTDGASISFSITTDSINVASIAEYVVIEM